MSVPKKKATPSLFGEEDRTTRIGRITDTDPLEGCLAFIEERVAIHRRREEGRPWPWTSDWIMQTYRFCNIRREHDATTREIAAWCEPRKNDRDLWFGPAVAREVNWMPTLVELGWPIPWDPDHFIDVCKDRQRRGLKIESSAYMIHANNRRGGAGVPKSDYIARQVLMPLWAKRKELRPISGDTLEGFCDALMDREGIGSFMAGQIIADLKFFDGPLKQAPDWWTFVTSGPGSRPGLNRLLLGRAVDADWKEGDWRREAKGLAAELAPDLKKIFLGRLDNQNFQNGLCEWNRYEKLRLGDDKGQRRYRYVGL